METTDIHISVVTGIGHISSKEIFQITDMISREDINNLVGVFYHPTFKTFYINSLDEKTFVHQTGVFVSLGITTSMKVLNNIKGVIETYQGYSASIVEISSRRVADQFLNTVIKTQDIQQYELTDLGDDVMDRGKAIQELDHLKEKLNVEEDLEVLKDITPKISKLTGLISKLDKQDSWSQHLIQKDVGEEDYRIFHKFVNYKQEGDVEYRIGIYVIEN